MSLYVDIIREHAAMGWPALDDAADELDSCEQAYGSLYRENNKLKAELEILKESAAHKYHWCQNCQSVQPFSIRENDETCADICCDTCHSIAATLYKNAEGAVLTKG